MKKRFIMAFGLLLTVIALVSCSSNKSLDGEVKLANLKADSTIKLNNEVTSGKAKLGAKLETIDYQYVVVDKDEAFVDLVINLDNPKDYHIFDFSLACNDINSKIKINGEYELISSLASINWHGDTNKQYKIELDFTKDLADVELDITNIYFSDRATGESKYSADLNNKGTFYVYKVDSNIDVKVSGIENGKYIYSLAKNDERIENAIITTMDKNYVFADKIYSKESYLTMTYDYRLSDTLTYSSTQYYEIDFINNFSYSMFYGLDSKAYVFRIYSNNIVEDAIYTYTIYDKDGKELFKAENTSIVEYAFETEQFDYVKMVITLNGMDFVKEYNEKIS